MAEARDRRGRGQALLRAPRRRRARHPARRRGRHHEPRRRAGRLDDHAAVRQERDQPGRAHDLAEAPRGGARVAARAHEVEGLDPHRVPEHDLLRERRLRRRAGLPHLLRPQRGHDVDAGRGRAARGHPGEPSLYDPVAHPKRGARAPQPRAAADARSSTTSTAAQYRRGDQRRRCRTRRTVRLPATQSPKAPYFANYVTDQLVQKFHTRERLRRRAARDDDDRPRAAEDGARGDREGAAAVESGPTAALVTLDAHTGAVLAMVGGRNYHKSQFNLATQGERQPGSSFKPFVLAAALEERDLARRRRSTSQPVTIDIGGRLWQVDNYEGDYIGTIDLRQAIAYSDNSVFAQLTNVVGPANVAADGEVARDRDAAATATSRSASAASRRRRSTWRARTRAFANGGYRIDGVDLRQRAARRRVPRGRRRELHRSDNAIVPHRVLEALAGGRDRTSSCRASCSYGTGQGGAAPRATRSPARPGTTENYGDAWFVGYTPDLVTAVWVGYPDELRPMLHRVPRQAGRRRHVPGADLEGVHGEGAAVPARRPVASSFPAAVVPVRVAAASVVLRDRKLLLDNGHCSGATTRAALHDGAARRRRAPAPRR